MLPFRPTMFHNVITTDPLLLPPRPHPPHLHYQHHQSPQHLHPPHWHSNHFLPQLHQCERIISFSLSHRRRSLQPGAPLDDDSIVKYFPLNISLGDRVGIQCCAEGYLGNSADIRLGISLRQDTITVLRGDQIIRRGR
jgi:hypothetical protein